MARILEESHWYFENGVSEVSFPRSYNASRDECAFIEDYRKTAAMSLLKYFVGMVNRGVDLANKARTLSVNAKQIEFALKRCEETLAFANEDDLDVMDNAIVSTEEWHEFVQDYIKFVHEDCALDVDENELSVSSLILELFDC